MGAHSVVAKQKDKHTRLVRFYNWLSDNSASITQGAAAVAGLVTGALGVVSTSWMWVALALTVVLGVVAFFLGRRDERRLSVLCDEIEKQSAILEGERSALRGGLQRMAERLLKSQDLWTRDCRISIYGHQGEYFYLIARASSNPKFAKAHRQRYLDTTGYISKIWFDTEYFRCFKGRPSYEKFSMENGYTPESLATLSMDPLSVCGIRLDVSRKKAGVLLIESEKKNGFDVGVNDRLRTSLSCLDIADTVEASEKVFEHLSLSNALDGRAA